MGRLTALSPQLGTLAPLFTRATDAEGHSKTLEPWRAWYSTAEWQALRRATFKRDLYTCQMAGCGQVIGHPICDHVIPHRGDRRLFFDPTNTQTLCKPCHDRVKQRQERRSGGHGVVSASRPGAMARPAWFRKVQVPLTVVCGPPGAGKSTYVRDKANVGDRVICFDELASLVFPRQGAQRSRVGLAPDQIADVLRIRNDAIADLMRPAARDRWPAAWLILTEPIAAHRRWWADKVGASIVVLTTPAAECRRRILADRDAGDDRGLEVLDQVDAWWRAYQPSTCDSPQGG